MNRRRALAAIAAYPFLLTTEAVAVDRLRIYRDDVLTGRTRSGILACDSFQRADGTTLGSTDGVPYLAGRPGLTWSEVAGNWEINGNRIGSQGSSPGGQGWLATLDIGQSDYTLEWTLAYAPDANNNAIVVAYVDGTNFIRLNHTSTTLGFGRITAGSLSSIGVGQSLACAAGDIVVVKKAGAAYTAWLTRAGAVVGSPATVSSETQGQSSTIVGLRAAAASVRWTNFISRRN